MKIAQTIPVADTWMHGDWGWGWMSLMMLMMLARARGQVVSRGTLLDEIWGDEIVTDNALDACASALRRSLASVTADAVVEAIRGQGYALRVSEDGGRR